MKSINDEYELDAPVNLSARWEYIRSATEPRVLIHPYTGETYRRRDGQPWPQMAYVLTRDKDDKLTRDTRATWGDSNGILPLAVPA
jgi:hypothetical protein